MTEAEAAIFEQGPLFKQCLRLREYDEDAKVIGLPTPSFEHFRPLVLAALQNSPKNASDCRSSFVRDGNVLVGIDASALVA